MLGTVQKEQMGTSHSGTKGAQATKLHHCTTSVQGRGLQIPRRVALKFDVPVQMDISSAVALRLPGLGLCVFLRRARAVPKEGSRVPGSMLSQLLMRSPASSCSQKLVEMQELGKASHGEGCGDDSSAGCPLTEAVSPGIASCNGLVTHVCSAQNSQKAGCASGGNFSPSKHT